jgi:serine/threonine-protein kinase
MRSGSVVSCRKAKAASALNHPNIVTVYDVGDTDSGRFIVMELVAGRTLRAVIAEHAAEQRDRALWNWAVRWRRR